MRSSLSPTDETSGDRELCSGLPPSKVGDSIIRLRPRLGAIVPGAACVGTAPCVAVPGLTLPQRGSGKRDAHLNIYIITISRRLRHPPEFKRGRGAGKMGG